MPDETPPQKSAFPDSDPALRYFSRPKPPESEQPPSSPQPFVSARPQFTPEPSPQFAPEPEAIEEAASLKKTLLISVVSAIFLVELVVVIFYFATKPEAIPEPEEEGLIRASEGAELVYSDGVRLLVPPGALAQDSVLSIERIPSAEITDIYHLKPEGTTFLKPVKVTIPYKEEYLKKGQSPRGIVLELWSMPDYKKRKIPFTIEAEHKVLHTSLTQF